MRINPRRLIFSDQLIFRFIRHAVLILFLDLLFIWVAYSRLSGTMDFVEVSGMVIFNSLFFFSYAYITTYLLFPVFLLKRRFILFGGTFLIVGISISYLKLLFSDYLFDNAISAEFLNSIEHVDAAQVVTNTKDMTFIVAIFLIAKYGKDNYDMRHKLLELRGKQLESEIKLIHNQLDPHVVFNNLNNIYTISLHKPGEVLQHIRKLNSLMVYYFIDSKRSQVPLLKELNMIRDFTGLEKLRYGERLDLQFTVKGIPEGRLIIPFVLFSFVENCFEHGCSIEAGRSWINIEVDIRRNSIHFYAENSRPNIVVLNEKGEPESSFENMRKKLELLYPGRHYLKTKDEIDKYSVALILRVA